MNKGAILSKFLRATELEAGLAQDLLEGKNWNYDAALKDFKELQGKRLSVQRQDPARNSPTMNGSRGQLAPNKTSPSLNGQRTPSPVPQNGGGVSPNSLQQPKLRDAPRSPATNKRLERGLSKANCQLVDFNRQKVIEDEEKHDYQLIETPRFTFILPDLFVFPNEFRAFVEKDLIDSCTMLNLENSGHLNWWAKTGACPKLWPMATTGDGNCLLHAASLGMWGFHDRRLTLRTALYKELTEHQHTAHMQKLKRRWRWQQTLANKESGLVYSESEWEEEWKALLKLASTVPRNQRYRSNGNKPTGGGPLPSLAEDQPYVEEDEELMYESLEEFHVFVLCHILRRPIIIVADTVLRDAHGQPLAPIPFGGIYLPMEFHPEECQRSPLVLTYDASHFSALVPMEVDSHRDSERQKRPPVIPLTDSNHHLLPLHFIVDPGLGWQWKDENHNNEDQKNGTGPSRLVYSPGDKVQLLHKYLDLVRLEIPEALVESSSPSPGDQEWELLPPKENGIKTVKVEVARSNSSGSDKSDKSGHKDKSKSFGKKLKNFARLDKSTKKASRKDGNEQFHIIEEKSQEGKTLPIRIEDVADRSIIVAARMDDVRLQGHEDMIRNYLELAKERFQEEANLKRMIEEENRRGQQQKMRYMEQQVMEMFIDDDERTNETALYDYATVPRAHLKKSTSSAPRREPIRQDYYDGGQVRNVQYVNTTNRNPVTHTRSNRVSPPSEPIATNTSYNPAVHRQGQYSPQQSRTNYHPQQLRYPPAPHGHQFTERPPQVQRLHVDDRNREIRSNPNPYATHVRGKRVPLSPEEKALQHSPPCRTYGCQFFGSPQTDLLCSKCYESIMRKKAPSLR